MSAVPVTLRKIVELEIDGEKTRVFEGSTILDACRSRDLEIPTLCYRRVADAGQRLPGLHGRAGGSRVLVPSCARKAEDGMVVRTASERVRHSRKMVLEFLGSSVDLSTTPDVDRWSAEYGARPERYGPPAPPAAAGVRDSARAGPPPRRRRADRSDRRPAGQGRQRELRPRLRASASSVTSASRPAAPTGRTRSRSRSRDAGSMRGSRPSSRRRCRSRPASTAATASRCAPPAR